MKEWRHPVLSVILWISLIYHRLELGASLNGEGMALLSFKKKIEEDPYGALSKWDEMDDNPCSWFGVRCSKDERVLALTLMDLSLKGTLSADLGKLIHVKSLILHNNSFYGSIPADIGRLQKLEVLDLGYNNLSGPVPTELENISSLELIIFGNNRLLSGLSPELSNLSLLSHIQADEKILSPSRGYISSNVESFSMWRFLQEKLVNKIDARRPSPLSDSPALAPSPERPPSTRPPFGLVTTSHPSDGPEPPPHAPPQPTPPVPPPAPTPSNDSNHTASPPSHKSHALIISVSVSGAVLLIIALSAFYVMFFRPNKVVSPWKTGLSGQLSKAFVTGVPSLRRAELETACENFSNIVGSLSSCLLYKGTLSNGEEIAVTSTMVKSAEEWSNQCEVLFRNKISSFSKVNHKNFMNLLGYCEEEEPFTRMMVFEYAPNGTLFEHLHIKEAEHLDWAARKRIIMGIAYCLMYIEQLGHPITLKNLNSNSIYITEDYAAKISNLEFWDLEEVAKTPPESAERESIIYKFAIVLLEVISGRLPFSEDDGLLVLWAKSYLDGKRPLKGMVDPTIESVSEEDLSKLADVIRTCLAEGNGAQQPTTMEEVAEHMRHITKFTPEQACPRLSPLWWAELEIISS